jgi:hypothetical protein
MSTVIHLSTVHYPESDGKPLAESDLHRRVVFRQIELLKDCNREAAAARLREQLRRLDLRHDA